MQLAARSNSLLIQLIRTGAPIDCNSANACAHRCVSGGPSAGDRCECFSGYKLASDGFSCSDLDECKLNLHTCNRQTEICDNTRGSFRCLARGSTMRHVQPVSSESAAEVESSPVNGQFEEQPKFASMRLCPPNQSWNAIEQRCQPKSSNHHGSATAQVLPSFSSNSHYRHSHSAASTSFASSSLRRRSVI